MCCSGSNFAGVLLAPGEVILQNDRGADGIQNGLAVGTKVPTSSRISAASQVDCRSSHIRTGRPLQICKVLPSLRLFSARSPSVPSMLSGRPTTMSSAFCSWAMRQTSAATLGRAFRVIWG